MKKLTLPIKNEVFKWVLYSSSVSVLTETGYLDCLAKRRNTIYPIMLTWFSSTRILYEKAKYKENR